MGKTGHGRLLPLRMSAPFVVPKRMIHVDALGGSASPNPPPLFGSMRTELCFVRMGILELHRRAGRVKATGATHRLAARKARCDHGLYSDPRWS